MSEVPRYQLKHPVDLTYRGPDGERTEMVREVELKRLKGKHLRALDTNPGLMGALFSLISAMTGLTVGQIEELDAEDVVALGEKVEGFMPPGLQTGQTSSGT